MAKLNFLLDGKLLSEFALDKERITIGRRPSNDIHIDNLAVSGEHAIIITMGIDSFLEDLNSTNGTMVNQKLIKKHVLQHNDVIEFGKYQLKFLSENQENKPHADGFANTVLVKDNPPVPAATPAAIASVEIENKPVPAALPIQSALPVVAATPVTQNTSMVQGEANVHVLSGAQAGQTILLNRAMVKLGNAGEQLAVITKRPHGYFITHVEGNAYPMVNGRSIGMQAYQLNDHEVIELADLKLAFHLA